MFNRVIITSGPTIEPIDPIRFISNRSSGKTGYHIANEAYNRGIKDIIFISGPTCFRPREEVHFISVESAEEMKLTIEKYVHNAEVIIMAAAVSDYKSRTYCPKKIKKRHLNLKLDLIKNPDILYEIGKKKGQDQILVGFAAETDKGIVNAKVKLKKKNLDLLVLNEISPENPVFGENFNQVFFLTNKRIRKLDKMKKAEIAVLLWNEIYEIAENRVGAGEKLS